MRLADAAPAFVMLALSTIMVIGTASLGLWRGFTAGPAFFPVLIALFTSVLAVALLLRSRRSVETDGVDWPDRTVLRTVGSVYGALLSFLALTPVLGMLASIMIFLAVVMILVLRQPLRGSLIAGVITTGFIYLIFVEWLGLPLPAGIIGL